MNQNFDFVRQVILFLIDDQKINFLCNQSIINTRVYFNKFFLVES